MNGVAHRCRALRISRDNQMGGTEILQTSLFSPFDRSTWKVNTIIKNCYILCNFSFVFIFISTTWTFSIFFSFWLRFGPCFFVNFLFCFYCASACTLSCNRNDSIQQKRTKVEWLRLIVDYVFFFLLSFGPDEIIDCILDGGKTVIAKLVFDIIWDNRTNKNK